jgi:uncharacterized protein (DUF1800 family)
VGIGMVSKTGNRVRKPLPALAVSALCVLAATPALSSETPLGKEDIAWLQRVGFGVNSAELSDYRKLGRVRFLDEQLADRRDNALPPEIASMIQGYEAINTPINQLVMQFRDGRQGIQAMPDGDGKIAAKKALRIHGRELATQAQQAELLRAIYGTDQLKEQMVWFWLNHFSVYAAKGGVAIGADDYEENVIRPRALGKFKDLLLATLESPAMLQFLDNAKNVKDKTNENYARELLELHTLGVGSGYSQQDVQQLALILTGAGLALGKGNGADQGFFHRQPPGMVRNGLFVFNPNKHDFSDKVFLGHTIKGSGADEITQAVDLIVQQPACATFVSQQIAEYFVADKPPAALVEAMAKTFQRTDGDIASVLRTMFLSKDLTASVNPANEARKFKDPTQFLVSAMRLAYDGQPIGNAQPLVTWLNQMGEPVFGRITPDGWPLDGSSWSSSGQMAKRFDVAHMIGSGKNRLFAAGDAPPLHVDPPVMNNAVYQQMIEPTLSSNTRTALSKAASPAEWNTFVLSSPEFNYR